MGRSTAGFCANPGTLLLWPDILLLCEKLSVMASLGHLHTQISPNQSQEFVSGSYELTIQSSQDHTLVPQPNRRDTGRFHAVLSHLSTKHPRLSGRLKALILYVRGPRPHVDLPRE